jgi:hypothetical protein
MTMYSVIFIVQNLKLKINILSRQVSPPIHCQKKKKNKRLQRIILNQPELSQLEAIPGSLSGNKTKKTIFG